MKTETFFSHHIEKCATWLADAVFCSRQAEKTARQAALETTPVRSLLSALIKGHLVERTVPWIRRPIFARNRKEEVSFSKTDSRKSSAYATEKRTCGRIRWRERVSVERGLRKTGNRKT